MPNSTKEYSLSAADKAAVLFLNLEEKNEALAQRLLDKLDAEKRSVLLAALHKKSLYSNESVEYVLADAYKMIVSKETVFPKKKSIEKIEQSLTEEELESLESALNIESSDMSALKTLIDTEASYFGPLLFYILDNKSLVALLSELPDAKVTQIVEAYNNNVPKSKAVLEHFKAYIQLVLETQSLQQGTANLKRVSRVIELLPAVKQGALKQYFLERPELAELPNSLFKLEDVAAYSPEDLRKIFDLFNDPKELALLFSLLSSQSVKAIYAILSERTVAMILEEKEALPLIQDEDALALVQNKLIQTIRKLEESGQIQIKDY